MSLTVKVGGAANSFCFVGFNWYFLIYLLFGVFFSCFLFFKIFFWGVGGGCFLRF